MNVQLRFVLECISCAILILTPSGAKAYTASLLPPRSTGPATGPVTRQLVDDVVHRQALPKVSTLQGRPEAMGRVLRDPVQRGKAIGLAAEADFVDRNPAWRQVASRNAPQNDVFTFLKGKFQGGQIKTHASGKPSAYMMDMLKDNRAEHFLVPDDHYGSVRKEIERRIELMRQRGNLRGVARWERQLKRLKPLGRTYAELEKSVVGRAGQVVGRARAIRAGSASAAIVLLVDGGVIVYRNVNGELTPDQTGLAAGEAAVKAGSVGLAAGGAILAGANPIGITVVVVGGVTYFVVDYAIDKTRPNYWSSPLTTAEIETLMPPGWRLDDPAKVRY